MKLEVSDSPVLESRLYCVPATQMDTGSTTLTLIVTPDAGFPLESSTVRWVTYWAT